MGYGSNFTNYYKGSPITQPREHTTDYLRQSPDDSLPWTLGSFQGSLCGMPDGQICSRICFSPKLQFYPCQLSFYRYTEFSHISSGKGLGYRLEDPEFEFRQGEEIFLSFKSSRLVLGVHPASFSTSAEVLSLGYSGRVRCWTNHFHLALSLSPGTWWPSRAAAQTYLHSTTRISLELPQLFAACLLLSIIEVLVSVSRQSQCLTT